MPSSLMASTSKMGLSGDDEEELERFDDFTLASAWERFISETEAVCRQWLADGPKNLREKGAVKLNFSQKLYKVKFDPKHTTKSYNMEYYFETNGGGKIMDGNSMLHGLQLCFGGRFFWLLLLKVLVVWFLIHLRLVNSEVRLQLL
uniref:Uncharacterized protein n=1 Tax=Populus trichocarpa TaxID=3694 RepID=A0A3N7FUT3_POPTR